MTSPVDRAGTPAELLAALVAADSTRPRITWYDDAEGPTRGERIELSARVLATWVAKAANLLVDDLGIERGDVVVLRLPVHWRGVYWALALWRVGAVLALDDAADAADAALVITDSPDLSPDTSARAPQVAVSLPALARRWTPGGAAPAALPDGVVDEAAELAAHPDVFEPYDPPEAQDEALRGAGRSWTAAELVGAARRLAEEQAWSAQARVAVLARADQDQLSDVLPALLAAWLTDGSVVLVRSAPTAEPAVLQARLDAERVTSAYGPPGRPASRS